MPQLSGILQVTRSGNTLIVAFSSRRIPEDERFGQIQDELMRLIGEGNCKELAFDLEGVRVIPSQLLGLMAWLSRNKVDVSIYHSSNEIRETLAFTQLDTIIDVQEGDP